MHARSLAVRLLLCYTVLIVNREAETANHAETRVTLVGIVGPTATGKTAVGIELARMLSGEIISADSMAVYRYMDIGTAKPTAGERDQAIFHLIDVVDPDEDFTVADFQRLANEAISDIHRRGKLPLLVGGTGLYVRAVTGGLNIPPAAPDKEIRERLGAEAERLGNENLLEKLRQVDPATAERLHVNDRKRIIRALEIYETTGTPMSEFHATAGTVEVPYDVRLFGLTMSRETLYRRIEERVDEQIASGLVDEVRGLLDRGYGRELTSMRGLGYKQIAAYLEGESDLEAAVDLLKRDTRRFAKRQFTWFRADDRIEWIDVEGLGARDAAHIIAGMLGTLPGAQS